MSARFWPLFWTQFLGALNDNFLKNALVVMITYKSLSVAGLDAPAIVALAGGIFILPFFLFSMMAGQIADRYEKSRLVRYIKWWELVITVVAAGGFYFHAVALLLIALFMMGTHSTFFGPIKYSAIPELVDEARLVTANAYVEAATFLAILLGTIGGGLIIAMKGGEVYIGLAINFCALLGLVSAYRLPPLREGGANYSIKLNPFTAMPGMVRLLRSPPQLYQAVRMISWFWFFGAAVLSLLPPYCKDFLYVDETVVTAFLAMFTLGIGLGSMLCGFLSSKRVKSRLVGWGALGMVVFLFDLSANRPQIPASTTLMTLSSFLGASYGLHMLLDFLFMSIAGGVFILPLYTLLQQQSERSSRSRVIAANNVFNAVFMVLSSLLVMLGHGLGLSYPNMFAALAVVFLVPAFQNWSL